MQYKKIFLMSIVSTLLISTNLFASDKKCEGGACFINLDNLVPTDKSKVEKRPFFTPTSPRFLEDRVEPFGEMIVTNEIEMIDDIDRSITIIINDEEVIVFPSYFMTEEEKVANFMEEDIVALNDESDEKLTITTSIKNIEDKILEKIELPTSEYYCEHNKHAVYKEGTEYFECV